MDRAIEIARRAGLPLRVAAKIDEADRAYFDEEIAPLFALPFVEYIGEIGEAEKQAFLGNARALLFPIDWNEPFGLVMIEAMACGTPIVAWPGGSVDGGDGTRRDRIHRRDDRGRGRRHAGGGRSEPPAGARRVRRTVHRGADGARLRRRVRAGGLGRERAATDAPAGPGRLTMTPKVPDLPGEISGETDRYYILATSALADDQDLVLKEGDTFGVFDRSGDIRPIGLAEEGLYHEGTRYLSRLSLRFGHQQPLLLSSAVKQDNALIAVDLTNLDISENGNVMRSRAERSISLA